MELSEPIPVPNIHPKNPNTEMGLKSSSPKSNLDPPPSDLDHEARLEDEFRNLDLRDAEDRDSIKEEESVSDDSSKIKTEVQNENDNENEKGNQFRKRYPYPVRPEAEDCAYYMKTGTCKFGSSCKFNHPARRKNQAAKEKAKEREDSTERPVQSQSQSQLECKYYLRTGGCKFGKACRFNHTRAKTSVAPILELNFLGLPIRLGEKECPYYMRNGSCKYGANCRFNHPDPTAVGGLDSPSEYANGGSGSSKAASQASAGSWSSPKALNETSSFVPMMFVPPSQNLEWNGFPPSQGVPSQNSEWNELPPSQGVPSQNSEWYGLPPSQGFPSQNSEWNGLPPSQGVPSQNSEWNGYQAPLYPPERSVHSTPTHVMNNPVLENNVNTNYQPQMLVDEFPERPDQPECSYFLKTGDCKYKSNCKYHHPKNRIPKSPPCALSDKGLPLRPDQNICWHYSRYGICKFGPACKFDHPIAAASTEWEDPTASFGNSATRQETGVAGTGNKSENKI